MSIQGIRLVQYTKGLSLAEYCVLISLASFADRDGVCWPSMETLRDSLVSINASFCTLGQRPEVPYGRPLHRLSILKYLNAVYADLDYYDLGLQRWEVIAEVARLESEGILPPHSLTIDTEHGMWLFWMLHDRQDSARSHLGVYADDLQLYSKVNRSIHGRLMHVGADPIPSAASYVRMDGSFREEEKCFVRWDAHGAAGSAFTHAPEH